MSTTDDLDTGRLALTVALAEVGNAPDSYTARQLRDLAAAAGLEAPEGTKANLIAALREQLDGLSRVTGDGLAGAPVAPPTPVPPPAAPVVVETAPRSTFAPVVLDVEPPARPMPPPAGVRLAEAPPRAFNGSMPAAPPPPGAHRPKPPASWEYALQTAHGAVVNRDGVRVVIGSTIPAPPTLPDGIGRPMPGPAPAVAPALVDAGSSVALPAAALAPAPTGAALGAYAQHTRDQIGTAILGLQQEVQRHLGASHPDRGPLLRELADISGKVNGLTARLANLSGTAG